MGEVFISSLEAKNQATKIGQASDKLTISRSITFSSSTTISGNSQAENTFNQFQSSSSKIKSFLNRDVQNIHSSVAAFERTDQQTKNLIEVIQLK